VTVTPVDFKLAGETSGWKGLDEERRVGGRQNEDAGNLSLAMSRS
jgi:hypothetical protein